MKSNQNGESAQYQTGLVVSVIVNTFDNPRGLSLTLAALHCQKSLPAEIIIADDGSGEETARVIEEFARRTPCPVVHVWHPHDGFRKCRILNRAIIETQGDYIIFFDGDCIPRSTCLQTHVRLARPTRYITGGIVRLGPAYSDRLTPHDIEERILDRQPWWASHVDKPKRLFVSHIPILRDFMDHVVRRNPGWRGGNASTFRVNLLKAGGFDERFSYGYEDADLGHRLRVLGVRGRSIRYTEPVCHVEHPRPYVTHSVVRANHETYLENRRARVGRTPHGIPEDPLNYPKDYKVVRYNGRS